MPCKGNIWAFLTNAPQGKILGKTTYDLGSLLKKIISQRKNRIVEGPLTENLPFGRVEGFLSKIALRAD
jgi:hypothetical protein